MFPYEVNYIKQMFPWQEENKFTRRGVKPDMARSLKSRKVNWRKTKMILEITLK